MIVGLTGGIATGKSTVSANLRAAGFCVIDADQIARDVVAVGTDGLTEIRAAFGDSILLPTGELDRARLGALIFSDESSRVRLNDIVHPRVRAEMWRQARAYVGDDSTRIAVMDVPLLIEGSTHTLVDVTVLVYAPEDVQVQRLAARNGLDEEAAMQRIRAQMPIEQKLALADVVVYNTGAAADVPRLTRILGDHLHRWAQEGIRYDTGRPLEIR